MGGSSVRLLTYTQRVALAHARCMVVLFRAGDLPAEFSRRDVHRFCADLEFLGTPVDRLNAAGVRRELIRREHLTPAQRSIRNAQWMPGETLAEARRLDRSYGAISAFLAGISVGIALGFLFLS